MSRGRVLFVAGNLPSPPSWGAGMRIYQLLRQVAATCDVTLLCAPHGQARRGSEYRGLSLHRDHPIAP